MRVFAIETSHPSFPWLAPKSHLMGLCVLKLECILSPLKFMCFSFFLLLLLLLTPSLLQICLGCHLSEEFAVMKLQSYEEFYTRTPLTYHQLRARKALLQIKDVLLRTRRALLPLTLYSNSALLVLNGTSLSCNNALLALNWQYAYKTHLYKHTQTHIHTYSYTDILVGYKLTHRRVIKVNLHLKQEFRNPIPFPSKSEIGGT